MTNDKFEIMLVCTPGLEKVLAAEAAEQRFALAGTRPGGVLLNGTWKDVWRANLNLRGCGAVLARIGEFRASHLSELDKSARRFPWSKFMPRHTHLRVSASCTASRVYHSGAVKMRLENALTEDGHMAIDDDADLELMARIDKEICTLSLNTSGSPLHKRGHKEAVGKAPLRETMASLFLRQCGYTGAEPVLDPMCGSGTFIIEAAEIACGLAAGRTREFSFQHLKSFDAALWAEMKDAVVPKATHDMFLGFDRNVGVIAAASANAERAGISAVTKFQQSPIGALQRPDGKPGLVIVNPPYGGRIGDKQKLKDLYGAFGNVMTERFSGWRVGLITNEEPLARATKLNFAKISETVLHGGLRVRLYQTSALP